MRRSRQPGREHKVNKDEMQSGSREDMLRFVWDHCGPPDPWERNEMQWGSMQELEQFMEDHPGQLIIPAFDRSQR